MKGLIDVAAELAKFAKERGKLEAKLAQIEGKLNNQKFLAQAPVEIVNKEKEKRDQLLAQLALIAETETRLKNLQ